MIDSSKVGEILLRSCKSSFSPEKHVLELNNMFLTLQSFNKLSGVHVVDVIGENKENEKICFFRVRCGLRLIDNDEEDSKKVQYELSAEYDAPFMASEDVSQEDIEKNSDNPLIMASIWPYWKEFVQSTCLKSGLKPLKITDYIPLKGIKLMELK